jgi:hypothetical protein
MQNAQDLSESGASHVLIDDDVGTNGDDSGMSAELGSWCSSAGELGDAIDCLPELAIPLVCRRRTGNHGKAGNNLNEIYPRLR